VDGQSSRGPIDIVQRQGRDLAPAQSVPREQQENGEVTSTDRRLRVARGEDTRDLVGRQRLWDGG
jgi:hypothetical protein